MWLKNIHFYLICIWCVKSNKRISCICPFTKWLWVLSSLGTTWLVFDNAIGYLTFGMDVTLKKGKKKCIGVGECTWVTPSIKNWNWRGGGPYLCLVLEQYNLTLKSKLYSPFASYAKMQRVCPLLLLERRCHLCLEDQLQLPSTHISMY
jgi:hypothetical protein